MIRDELSIHWGKKFDLKDEHPGSETGKKYGGQFKMYLIKYYSLFLLHATNLCFHKTSIKLKIFAGAFV